MRQQYYITLAILILCNCAGKKDCEIDYEFTANFQNCINIITAKNAGIPQNYDQVFKAYSCLELLTKKEGMIDKYSDTPMFYPESDSINYLCVDLNNWLEWYGRNKCSITMRFAAKTLNSDSLQWPLFMESIAPYEFEVTTYTDSKGCIYRLPKDKP